jgi:hypothetical protein
MATSTFSFLATSVLFALPTAAHMIGNRNILYQPIAADFQKSVANEIGHYSIEGGMVVERGGGGLPNVH